MAVVTKWMNQKILKVCKSAKLDMSKLRGQRYDGVASMAGECNGAAKLLFCK